MGKGKCPGTVQAPGLSGCNLSYYKINNALPFALAASMHCLVLAEVEHEELEWSQLKNGQFGDVEELFITRPLQCLCH